MLKFYFKFTQFFKEQFKYFRTARSSNLLMLSIVLFIIFFWAFFHYSTVNIEGVWSLQTTSFMNTNFASSLDTFLKKNSIFNDFFLKRPPTPSDYFPLDIIGYIIVMILCILSLFLPRDR